MNPDQRTISVVIPLYNGARFIAQALDSVFAQSLLPTEVIVVDDGSTDEGPDIVSSYRVAHDVVLLQKANGGQSSARNFGISHSQGKLIALLDQDDIWYPEHLNFLSRPFLDDVHHTLGWVYSNLDEITEDSRLRVRAALSASPTMHPKTQLDKCLRRDMFVLPSASMISRSAFDAIGGFDEELSGYEDDDLFLRLFVAGYRNVYVEEPLGQWRVYPASSSYTPRMARSRMLYAGKLLRTFPNEPSFSRFYASDLIAPRFLRQVVGATRTALREGNQKVIDTCLEDISLLETHIKRTLKFHPVRQELLITAVIPLYNGAPFIREAIQSILGQILVPDEIIVVDDGSTDAGPDIVADMARHHPIRILTKTNGGQSSARNLGVDHANGDLIAFLDQDDIWYPDHLAKLVKPFLQRRTVELGWSYSDLDEINEAGEMISRELLKTSSALHPKRNLVACLTRDMFILPTASLISRQAFKAIGGFNEQLSGYEDDDLFLRLFQAGYENVFLPESLSKWRIYQKSSSYSPRMAVSRAIYAKMLIERFPDDMDLPRHYVTDIIAPRFFRLMAMEWRKAILKGSKDQQKLAYANLLFITCYLRAIYRLPLRLFALPALRIPPLARFVMRHRLLLHGLARRVF